MSIIGSIHTMASALRAFERGFQARAHNVANLGVEGYRGVEPVFLEGPGGATIVELREGGGDGGIDMASEAVGMGEIKTAYRVNAAAVKSADEMLGTLIDILE